MISSNYFLVTLVIVLIANVPCEAQLSSTFYDSTCPNALSTIRNSIRQAVSREQRMAASLVRLHFHDCFVQGCDGSILLNDTAGERAALQNANSVRGFEVVEAAKQAVEAICPGVVSCADVLAVAARDATVAVGGQSWTVKLGRRDSTTAATRAQAQSDLPLASDSLQTLISNFANKNLNERDMVALSGSHTIGQARCVTFRARIYGNTSIDAGFASTRQRQCPQTSGNGDGNLAPLDLVTPNSFDNNYFRNLVQLKGLLASDQVLFSGGSSDSIVQGYISNPRSFQSDFGASMIKMGDIEPLTGGNGIIRRTCGSAN
ncbi:lignin-forming anionic peroxidase-like [Salvia hispanica]|uniref:lignin-forming anionic peroxidase-like n=1 Tax=Salvia hispanica TaxID=49212 RepID=UPI002009A51B|nr:lignin-forming anionic peroxidase-like [Salvia hispanica]